MSGGDGMPRRIVQDVERDGRVCRPRDVRWAWVWSCVGSSVWTDAAYGHPGASCSVDVYALNYIWFQEHNKK